MSSVITPENSSSLFDRRDFLRLMGASVALLPLEACRDKMAPESLIPYIQAPDERLLGLPQAFATSYPVYGLTQGLLVTSHEGRPTKIEGNPSHPMSRGATSVFAQASVLDLYDPNRLRKTRFKNAVTEKSLDDLKKWLSSLSSEQKKKRGAGFCLITEPLTSPSLIAAIESLKLEWPEMLWVSWSPLHHDEIYAGSEIAFGQPLSPFFDFSKAGSILSLDHDFLGSEHDAVARTRAWADRRREGATSTLRMLETTLSLTGAKADARTAVTRAEIGHVIASLEKRNGADAKFQAEFQFLTKANDPLVLLGSQHGGAWHSRVHRINFTYHSKAVRYRKPVHPSHVGQTAQLRAFHDHVRTGHITTCVIIGGNPAFTAPADFDFASALRSIPNTLHVSDFANETSALCTYVAPRSHYLETWGDVETTDGSVSLMQPLILPLYESLDDHQVIETITRGAQARSTQAIVSDHWKKHGIDDLEFKNALGKGLLTHTDLFVSPKLRDISFSPLESVSTQTSTSLSETLTLRLAADPTLLDGRFSENAWLQELPKPITSLTWDNAVLLSPVLAKKIGVKNEEHVEIRTRAGLLIAAAFILEGLPDRVVTLHVGSGRQTVSPVGEGSGFDAYRLRGSNEQWFVTIDSLKKVTGTTELARPQTEMPTERQDLYTANPSAQARKEIGHGLAPAASTAAAHSKEYQWAMSIDLDTCTGCMNCVIACQAENNIPVVGKKQVLNGRIMHWMRIDRYQSAGLPRPQPVTCMHCEKAPCEVVCPVEATVHSSEGLNQMVYNRCVGTRYCSNNCPYKVRRFNFYKYTDETETLKMQRNPDVTVRSRGVMEKCSYCVHRVSRARIQAEKEDRLIRDGEVVTACQAACPPRAIVFGNLLDPNSEVSRLRQSARTYGLLTDLGTRPRTTYMAPQKAGE